jgi:hypothetical protein
MSVRARRPYVHQSETDRANRTRSVSKKPLCLLRNSISRRRNHAHGSSRPHTPYGACVDIEFALHDVRQQADALNARLQKLIIPGLLGLAQNRTGGARRDRTDDLMLAKHALSQLSYGPSGQMRV